ncbi:alpha/beta fold hydrolase [Micromonospora zhanjiangensis]|uniref:Alpha/beta fold hydrolase n=1 Tax=Micromonospora zhanjiangensis TaxID=1522057 RepID=A0ABV8KFP4_9ACTN
MVLHVHRFGPVEGRSLVVLHGLTGHGRRWRTLASEELPTRRVVAPDLRGHGRSAHEPPWSLEQHATDVLSMMDALDLETVPVVGHSLGAAVAVHLARRAPRRIDRLVLLDPAMGIPSRVAGQLAHDALTVPEFDDPTQAGLERTRSWPVQARRLIGDEVDAHLARGDDGRWRWRYRAPACVTAYSELARSATMRSRKQQLRARFAAGTAVRRYTRLGRTVVHETADPEVVIVEFELHGGWSRPATPNGPGKTRADGGWPPPLTSRSAWRPGPEQPAPVNQPPRSCRRRPYGWCSRRSG